MTSITMASLDQAECSNLDNSPRSNLGINQISRSNPVPPDSNKTRISGKPSAVPINTLERCQSIQRLLSKDPPSYLDFFKLLMALVPERDVGRNGCACNIQSGPQAPKPPHQPSFNHNTSHFVIELLLTSHHPQWMNSLARKHTIFQRFIVSTSDEPSGLQISTPVSMNLNLRFSQSFTIKRCQATPIVVNSTLSQRLETSLPSQTVKPLASLDRMTLAYDPTFSRNERSLTFNEQVVLRLINANLTLLKRLVGAGRYLERLPTRFRNQLLDHSLKSLQSRKRRPNDGFTSERALFEDFALKFGSFDRGEKPTIKTQPESAGGHPRPAKSSTFVKTSLRLLQETLAPPQQSASRYGHKLTAGSSSNNGTTVILNQKPVANYATAQGDLLDILRLLWLYLAFRLYVGIRFLPIRFKKRVIPHFHAAISKIKAIHSGPDRSLAATKTSDGVRLPGEEMSPMVSVGKLSPLLTGTTSIMKNPDDVGCNAFPPKIARKVSWNDDSGPWNSEEVSRTLSDGEASRQLTHMHHKNSKIMPKSPKPKMNFALTQKKKAAVKPTIERFRLPDGGSHECLPVSPLSSSMTTSSASSSKNEDQMSDEETHSIIEHTNNNDSVTRIMISSPRTISS